MGCLGHLIAVLLYPVALGVDFLVDPGSNNAHRVYVKTAVSAKGLTEMGPDVGLSLIHHHMQKRDAVSCNRLEGYEKKLNKNTNEVSSHGSEHAFMHGCGTHNCFSVTLPSWLHCSSFY